MYFPEDGASDIAQSPPNPGNALTNLDFNVFTHIRLKSLAIDAEWITRIPVWVYNQLVSVEINSDDPAHPINIDFICHHCPMLEDLSATGEIWAGLCLGLSQETTFSKLQSLRLSCEGMNSEGPVQDAHISALAQFIRAHHKLRRLYLRFPDAPWRHIMTLLEDIEKLQNIEVLGLHAGFDDLDEGALEHLLSHIPFSQKALQLSMAWDTNTGRHVPILVRVVIRHTCPSNAVDTASISDERAIGHAEPQIPSHIRNGCTSAIFT
jgi:hypothetical protein